MLGLLAGAVAIPGEAFVNLLFNRAGTSSDEILVQQIVLDIRLPRTLLVAFVGCLLAVSGAVMQGLFRNPLADPSLIGVSAGASAGAATLIVLGDGFFMLQAGNELAAISLVSLGAFIGGALTVWLVYRLATSATGTSVSTMLLAGIAITALAGSYSSLLEYLADNSMLRRISLWRMGSFVSAKYYHVAIAAVLAVLLLLRLSRYASALNALLLGESEARHLGVDVQRLKLGIIAWVALAVGVSVALAGAIAFVGLVVPHMVRLMVGPDHRNLIPLSALLGAVLLVLADSLSRTLIAPAELPIGILTAATGAPFFISLLRHRNQYGW